MFGRAVGVTVDQGRKAVLAEQRCDGVGIDVHYGRGLLRPGLLAFHAHAGDDLLAHGQRLAEELRLHQAGLRTCLRKA